MTDLLARLLQMAGLIILPIGLSMGLFGGNVALEVRLLAIGGAVFLIGWLLGKTKRT